MKNYRNLFLIASSIVLTFSASIAVAQGSAGVRGIGGGTGLICPDSPDPIMIEEYMLKLEGEDVEIPETREGVEKLLKKELGFGSGWIIGGKHYKRIAADLESISSEKRGTWDNKEWRKFRNDKAEAILYFWKTLKDYDSWDALDEQDIRALISGQDSAKQAPVINQIKSILSGFGVSPPNKPHVLVGDDFYPTPKDCQKVQLGVLVVNPYSWLSSNDSLTPHRVTQFTLSERTKRILELHEAFYAFQMTFNLETFPGITRNLIIHLNDKKRGKLRKDLRDLTSFKQSYGKFPEFSYHHFFKLKEPNPLCPIMGGSSESELGLKITTAERKSLDSKDPNYSIVHAKQWSAGHYLLPLTGIKKRISVAAFPVEDSDQDTYVDIYHSKLNSGELEMDRYRADSILERGSPHFLHLLAIFLVNDPNVRGDPLRPTQTLSFPQIHIKDGAAPVATCHFEGVDIPDWKYESRQKILSSLLAD